MQATEPQKLLSSAFFILDWLAKPKSVQGCRAGGLAGEAAMWWAWGQLQGGVEVRPGWDPVWSRPVWRPRVWQACQCAGALCKVGGWGQGSGQAGTRAGAGHRLTRELQEASVFQQDVLTFQVPARERAGGAGPGLRWASPCRWGSGWAAPSPVRDAGAVAVGYCADQLLEQPAGLSSSSPGQRRRPDAALMRSSTKEARWLL